MKSYKNLYKVIKQTKSYKGYINLYRRLRMNNPFTLSFREKTSAVYFENLHRQRE